MAEQHEKALVPQIRFTGFTDPWEQRKLEDYVVVSTAKNVDGRFNKEDVLSVSGEYGIVNQIAFQGRSFAGSSVLNYGIVNTGDIVYTKSPLNSNPYGIIKVNKGIPGIVSTLYAVYRPQDNVHTNFIQVYFEQHERMNNYMHPLVNKGAKNDMKVTAENALKGVVTFPSREEQVIISEFFDRLDSLITLHQRKYDKLCVLKKSMLDKMFPKGGSLYPEIRFAGFTDPWEQRKLGELTESYSGGTPAAGESEFYGGSIPFIRSAEIAAESTELFLTEKGYESSSARMVKPGDVLYALYGATSGEVAVSRQKGAINQAILAILPRDDCDARYITAWLRKQKGYIVTTYLQGGQGNLSGVIVKNLEVFIPSLPEQQKIGFMLSHLDSLITLHQRKYCGVASWMLGVALVRLGSESDGAFGEMKHVLQ